MVAGGAHQTVRTEMLEVGLNKPIRFDAASPRAVPNARSPRAANPLPRRRLLWKASRSTPGAATSLEKMQLRDLDINLASGETAAAGPGWMTMVRRGMGDILALAGGLAPAANPSPASQADQNRARLLGVRSPARSPAISTSAR